MSLAHPLEPDYSALYDRNEVYEAVRHFGVAFHEVPCLVFFRTWTEETSKWSAFVIFKPPNQATLSFRDFFDGPDFKRLLNEARSNAGDIS